MFPSSYLPTLKATADVQLQTAFSECNWASVARLADKRARSLKDSYYEAVKLCAESKLEGSREKCAIVFVVDDLVRKDTVVKDLEAIELYEWACRDFQRDLDYAKSFGVLRLRWVKANPRGPGATKCLQACLQHWDLVNAQQIAAILDKSSPNSSDRRLRFWSVTLTFLLSISPQCPDGKQKLYGLLSLKQLQRAADITESSDKDDPTDRGLRTEEELHLYYRVLARHGSQEDFMKQMRSPKLGALKQLAEGRRDLFLDALDKFEAWGKWHDIYDVCLQALGRTDDDGAPSFVASDWRVWKRFIEAASKSHDDKKALEQVERLLRAFVSTKAKVPPMYKKTIALAVLETAFRLPHTLQPESRGRGGMTPRVAQIGQYLDNNWDRLSAFDDVKGYVATLTFEELHYFLSELLPSLAGDLQKPQTTKSVSVLVLKLKFAYLATTCPQTLSSLPSVVEEKSQSLPYRCRICSNLTSRPCGHCLTTVVTKATSAHRSISRDEELVETIPSLEKDPRLDLSLVIAMSVLKMAGLNGQHLSAPGAPLHNVDPSRFLQAVLVLDEQLSETPGEVTLRLLLVQLYLLLGCASYAYQLWTPMNVIRTIQDALSPLFFDRIFSLSPGSFQGSESATEPLHSYYLTNLRDKSPVRIWDAFSSGSYSSILDVAEFDNRLRRSCTLMMAMVEERCAWRVLGSRPCPSFDESSYIAEIHDGTEFVNSTDYGSFPSLESLHSPPVQDLLRLGPGLSNERTHLSLLAEEYIDVLAWKPPREYKPSNANEAAVQDKSYLVESLARLHNSFTNFLQLPSTPTKLTAPEQTYFTVLSLLSGLLLTALTTPPGVSPPPTLSVLTSSLKAAIGSLRTAFLSTPPYSIPQPDVFSSLVDMHSTSTLRDTALAIKHSTTFVLAFHDKEMARDKTGNSRLHKDVVAEMKALDALAVKVLGDVRRRIGMLNDTLGGAGWLDRLLDWTFAGEDAGDEVARAVSGVVGGRAGAEEWAGRVVGSWREGLQGWHQVKME